MQDQPGTRDWGGSLDPKDWTNGEEGDLARGERQDQLRKDPQKRIDFALMRTRFLQLNHIWWNSYGK